MGDTVMVGNDSKDEKLIPEPPRFKIEDLPEPPKLHDLKIPSPSGETQKKGKEVASKPEDIPPPPALNLENHEQQANEINMLKNLPEPPQLEQPKKKGFFFNIFKPKVQKVDLEPFKLPEEVHEDKIQDKKEEIILNNMSDTSFAPPSVAAPAEVTPVAESPEELD